MKQNREIFYLYSRHRAARTQHFRIGGRGRGCGRGAGGHLETLLRAASIIVTAGKEVVREHWELTAFIR